MQKEPMHLTIFASGQNWITIGSRIAVGLGGYYSPLPAGSTVAVVAGDPGRSCFEAPVRVADSEYDMAITTPNWVAKVATEGREPFDRKLNLRSLASFDHEDRLVFAVRRETGISSIAEIKEKKYPLKLSAPMRETNHPAAWCAERVMNEYGFGFDDIERWGGKVLRDRPRDQKMTGAVAVSDESDAVFDEAIMTNRWISLTTKYDLKFLPIDHDVAERLKRKSWPISSLRAGLFRGIDSDVTAVDFSGWWMFCRDDMDDEIAYYTIKAIDDQTTRIRELFPEPASGMTRLLDLSRLARNVPISLHPGAEQYYKEKGYL
jgi:TRAP-type uncharacterized transport system substrate-binding protein